MAQRARGQENEPLPPGVRRQVLQSGQSITLTEGSYPLILLHKGLIIVDQLPNSGSWVCTGFYRPLSVAGDILETPNGYPTPRTITAMEDSGVYRINRSALPSIPDSWRQKLQQARDNDTQAMNDRLAIFRSNSTIETRLASVVLQLDNGTGQPLDVKQAHLVALAVGDRSRINQLLVKFFERGLLDKQGHTYSVTHPTGVEGLRTITAGNTQETS